MIVLNTLPAVTVKGIARYR